MKKWLLNSILKTRDRLWFYVRQQYPADTPENHESYFRRKFCSFTFSPSLMILFTLDATYSRILGLKKGDGNNVVELILIAVAFGFIWWYFNRRVLSILSIYPIDNRNDLGKLKNLLYCASIVVFSILFSIGYIPLFNTIWPRPF